MERLLPNRMADDQPDSVIAKLMGMDVVPVKFPSSKRCRVLSDDYICKVSSVCVREGSSIRRKYSTKGGMLDGTKMNVGERSLEQAEVSLMKSLSTANYKKERPLAKEVEDCDRKSVLRYHQRLDADADDELGVDYTKLNFCFDRLDRQSRFLNSTKIPKSGKLINGFRDGKTDLQSRSGYRKQRDDTVDAVLVLRRSCMICDGTVKRIARRGTCRSKSKGFKDYCRSQNIVNDSVLSSSGNFEDKNQSPAPHRCLDQSSSDAEANEENTDNFKTGKEVEETVDSFDKDSLPRNLNLKLDRNDCELKQDEYAERDDQSKKQKISSKDFTEPRGEQSSEQFQSSQFVKGSMSESSKYSEAGMNPESSVLKLQDKMYDSYECRESDLGPSICDIGSEHTVDKALDNGVCFGITEEEWSGSDPANLSLEDGCTTLVPEVSSEKVSLDEFAMPDAYSNSSRIRHPDFQDDLNGFFQRSPDSVLEPFDNQHSTLKTSESLQLLLQALNSESVETYSEGSVVIVSGNEDSGDEFSSSSHDGLKIEAWFEDDESRNFSYLVDVLDEAGFCGVESFIDFDTWHSLECPISPLVFDSLEKKYAKQTSWQKSERHLLFDRINLGLSDILNPVRNFHASAKSVRRKFSEAWKRDEIEDELWMMLVSQGKEMSRRDLSEKVMSGAEKWLEYDEDVNIICGEVATILLDELLLEFASVTD